MKKYDEAIMDYTKSIALDSMFKRAYFNRGNSYGKLKKYAEAINDFTTVIKLDSNFATAYDWRGVTYKYVMKYELAIKDFKTAIAINPKDTIAWFMLGGVMLDLRDYKKSRELTTLL